MKRKRKGSGGYIPHHFSSKNGEGYTAIEIVIVASIMMMISAIVLVGFGGLNDSVAVNRSARDLAVSLRRAQNMALAVTGIPAIGNVVPPAVGVELTIGSSVYYMFADRNDIVSPNNFRYDPASERIQETTFDRGARVKEFRVAEGSPFTPPGNKLNIVFSAPEANPDITDGDGAGTPPDAVDIILESPGGKTKMITVRESGQISVK